MSADKTGKFGKLQGILKSAMHSLSEYCTEHLPREERQNARKIFPGRLPHERFIDRDIFHAWLYFRHKITFPAGDETADGSSPSSVGRRYLTGPGTRADARQKALILKACETPFRFFTVLHTEGESCQIVDTWTGGILNIAGGQMRISRSHEVLFGQALTFDDVSLFTHRPVAIPLDPRNEEQIAGFLRNMHRLANSVAMLEQAQDRENQKIILENQLFMLARQYLSGHGSDKAGQFTPAAGLELIFEAGEGRLPDVNDAGAWFSGHVTLKSGNDQLLAQCDSLSSAIRFIHALRGMPLRLAGVRIAG